MCSPHSFKLTGGHAALTVKSIWKRTELDPAETTWGEGHSLSNHLGIQVTEIGDDFVVATMPVDERTLQPHGRLHGGASVTLAETVGSMVANFTLDPTEQIAVGLGRSQLEKLLLEVATATMLDNPEGWFLIAMPGQPAGHMSPLRHLSNSSYQTLLAFLACCGAQ